MTSTWRAPGRVNLIGEHVDYNDGLVLPFAIQQATEARVTRRDDDTVRVVSEGSGAARFTTAAQPGDVEGWAAYVAGVVWALARAGVEVPGLDIAVRSDVPVGAGLSSSAALTCSVAAAIGDEAGASLSPRAVAEVARQAENAYVGVPTGAMDQLAAVLCEAGHALLVDCRDNTAEQIPFDPAAAGLSVLLVDTGARHSLVGSEYRDRRAECDQALAALDRGSWRDVAAADLARIADPTLRRRGRHVVSEIARVGHVAALLRAGAPAEMGAALTASHESLRDDFAVSCAELDATVEAALGAGALGARMVGGGFGGCVLALCRADAADEVLGAVDRAYADRGWDRPARYRPRPSPGARRV